MKFLRTLTTLTILLSLSFGATLKGLRVGFYQKKVRIVFDLSDRVKVKSFILKGPYRIVIDFYGVYKVKNLKKIKGFKIRVGKHPWGRRVVLIPSFPFSTKRFYLREPERFVVDVYREAKTFPHFRKITVVIDPGHGGKDPGAIGFLGIREKDVNLKIAKELYRLLRGDKRFRVVLTRKGDYYVPLKERSLIAVREKADLFISIHSDAAPKGKPYAVGTQIFAVSYEGLKDRVRDKDFVKMLLGRGYQEPIVRKILLDLAMDLSLEESVTFGRILAFHLKKFLSREVVFRGIKRARFEVLKNPGIPSILLETGFITNPEEALKLVSRDFQKRLAKAIYKSIVYYFFKERGV